jgi:ELWxxDGT repeat protein
MRRLTATLLMANVMLVQAQVALTEDINPGTESSYAYGFTPFNNEIYFGANDGTHSYEIWKYDGTNAPSMLVNLNTDDVNANEDGPSGFIEFNSKLYFRGFTPTTGYDLWEYDGTNTPTLVHDFNATGYGGPAGFVEYGSKLYMVVNLNTYVELWEYDGTSTPHPVSDNLSGTTSIHSPVGLVIYNNELFFQAEVDGVTGIYTFDGSNSPALITDQARISGGGDIIEFNSKLYFGGYENVAYYDNELWEFDGTTVQLSANIDPDSTQNTSTTTPPYYQNQTHPIPKYVFNNKLYFRVQFQGQNQLWVYDGVNPPVQETDISSGTVDQSHIWAAAPINNKLYYTGDYGTHGDELWEFDGVNPPQMIADINPNGDSDPNLFFEFQGKIYFRADDGTHGHELFVLDPSSNSVSRLTLEEALRIYPNPATSEITVQSDYDVENVSLLTLGGSEILQSTNTTLSIASLPVGIYIVAITTSEGIIHKQLIKQ